MTFEKILSIKEFLQLHDNEFDRLEILDPLLEWWHTLWTDLSRLYGCHWGADLSHDPSSLGHSAAKIGRKKPSNLKKVDYYQHSQLAYLVLDVRILDCWRFVIFMCHEYGQSAYFVLADYTTVKTIFFNISRTSKRSL